MQGSDRVSRIEKEKKRFDEEFSGFVDNHLRAKRKLNKPKRISGTYYFHKRFSNQSDNQEF